MSEYPAFPKIPRLHRDVIITEKIDGTNALVEVRETALTDDIFGGKDAVELDNGSIGVRTILGDFFVRAGSRKRWITPHSDNFGFATWVRDNAAELARLGPGQHYGEWYGQGIQRGYGLNERRFALFNVSRWSDDEARPACCDAVPKLAATTADRLNEAVDDCLHWLREDGSRLVRRFMRPEGVVVYHTASGHLYKVLLENDDRPKGQAA